MFLKVLCWIIKIVVRDILFICHITWVCKNFISWKSIFRKSIYYNSEISFPWDLYFLKKSKLWFVLIKGHWVFNTFIKFRIFQKVSCRRSIHWIYSETHSNKLFKLIWIIQRNSSIYSWNNNALKILHIIWDKWRLLRC